MGFFKKLFGKSKQKHKTDNDTGNDTQSQQASQSGKIEILESEHQFYPFFIRHSESKKILANNSLVSVFHANQDEEPDVIQTVALYENGEISLPQTHDMSNEMFDALLVEGAKRIELLDIEFEFHPEYEKKVIAAQGHVLSCESILSMEAMLKAHVMLDAEEIMVSIPRRGMIAICNNDVDEETKQSFFNLHAYLWISDEEDTSSRIAKDIFILKHGEIQGVLFLPLEG